MVSGALLEYGGLVERPVPGCRFRPVGMLADERKDVPKVRLVVRAEIERRPFGCARPDGEEKFLGHDTVLVVATLRPGIGEKDEDRREARLLGHHGEEISGVSADKLEICEARTVPFAFGTGDSIRGDVDPDADLIRMSLCISCEEMAVPASDFPDEAGGQRYEFIERPAQLVAPFG